MEAFDEMMLIYRQYMDISEITFEVSQISYWTISPKWHFSQKHLKQKRTKLNKTKDSLRQT
ncbi:unnamed protein product [Musa textilis]